MSLISHISNPEALKIAITDRGMEIYHDIFHSDLMGKVVPAIVSYEDFKDLVKQYADNYRQMDREDNMKSGNLFLTTHDDGQWKVILGIVIDGEAHLLPMYEVTWDYIVREVMGRTKLSWIQRLKVLVSGKSPY